jgi:ferredoxin-type protein NapG
MTDRRAALGELARGFAGLISLRGPKTPDYLWVRPPGAVAESGFRRLCDGCGECVEACPHAAIGVLPPSAGRDAGTPAMAVEVRPCHLCEDTPCITACDRGALVPYGDPFFFGLAEIENSKCFAFQGPECGACASACPTKAMTSSLGKPQLNVDACNGCGLCREACPVFSKAIRIV